MNEWMNDWMKEWMNEWINEQIQLPKQFCHPGQGRKGEWKDE
jgi:hypothetical protein